MVSTEYPPMIGGVGRYTSNLTNALKKSGQDVYVVSDEKGGGDYKGLSPTNKNTSELMLKLVDDVQPDVVHIQFEPGLYGLHLDPFNPKKCKTNIDLFYDVCKIPIITTFHSVYTFREWLGQISLVKKTGKTGKLGIPARFLVKSFKSITHYNSFIEVNKHKLGQSNAGICFSKYMSKLLGGKLSIIYHGAESYFSKIPTKEEARRYFSIPFEKKVAATVGFRTITKGWDILDKVNLPDNWVIISNSAQSHYSKEIFVEEKTKNQKVIDLKRGYLTEEELSLLFHASDAILLPYKITSGSGVMFDALAHGLPFVASDLEFFKEFADMDLGITSKRDPKSFEKSIDMLSKNYNKYSHAVDKFREKLKWENISTQHIEIYSSAIKGGKPDIIKSD